jgi:hypothetical protein
MIARVFVAGAIALVMLGLAVTGFAGAIAVSPVASVLALISGLCSGYLFVGGLVVWRRSGTAPRGGWPLS